MLSLSCSSMSPTYLDGRWEQMLHPGRRWRRPTLPKPKAGDFRGQELKDWKQPVALAESSLKISWYLQVKGASLHGPERHGPLTNNPASSVSPDALTEVKRKGDEGKAGVRLQSDTWGNDWRYSQTTRRGAFFVVDPYQPFATVIFGGWIISWNARARPFIVKWPGLHQWIHWRYFCGTWSLGFFILHSSKNRKGKKLEVSLTCSL